MFVESDARRINDLTVTGIICHISESGKNENEKSALDALMLSPRNPRRHHKQNHHRSTSANSRKARFKSPGGIHRRHVKTTLNNTREVGKDPLGVA